MGNNQGVGHTTCTVIRSKCIMRSSVTDTIQRGRCRVHIGPSSWGITPNRGGERASLLAVIVGSHPTGVSIVSSQSGARLAVDQSASRGRVWQPECPGSGSSSILETLTARFCGAAIASSQTAFSSQPNCQRALYRISCVPTLQPAPKIGAMHPTEYHWPIRVPAFVITSTLRHTLCKSHPDTGAYSRREALIETSIPLPVLRMQAQNSSCFETIFLLR